jgi:hypothetical protein
VILASGPQPGAGIFVCEEGPAKGRLQVNKAGSSTPVLSEKCLFPWEKWRARRDSNSRPSGSKQVIWLLHAL